MAINRTFVSWSRVIHIYLSVGLLLVLVFFSVTGITLNHASSVTADPTTETRMQESLPELPLNDLGLIANSPELEQFLRDAAGIRLERASMSQDEDLLIIDYKAPGKAVYVEIDQLSEKVLIQTTDFGTIAMLNDLHKARDTDAILYWFIDVSAVFLVLFSLAGLVLLLPSSARFIRVCKYTGIAIVLMAAGYYVGNM